MQRGRVGRSRDTESEEMGTGENWEKTDANTITIDVWLFDPRLYLEPWYVQRRYALLPNPDKNLRIRYWDCSENPNNDVTKTQGGGTDFKGFTFSDKSNNKSNPLGGTS